MAMTANLTANPCAKPATVAVTALKPAFIASCHDCQPHCHVTANGHGRLYRAFLWQWQRDRQTCDSVVNQRAAGDAIVEALTAVRLAGYRHSPLPPAGSTSGRRRRGGGDGYE